MAIIEAISSKANLKRIINYVTQDKKTTKNLITGKDCLAESCLEEMQYVKDLYHKNNGRQYIHIIQSFDPKDNLSVEQIYKAGIKVTETFKNFQVLIATHIDKNHLHNHLIINSVSFEDGYKIQISKNDLQNLKDISDKICVEIGASIITKNKNSEYIKRNDYRVAERGSSWKFKLINAIDTSLLQSSCKDDFIKNMNKLGYQVNWTDTRKYITYTTPDGYKCRDIKLFNNKYTKGEMENEFRRIKEEQQNRRRASSNSINCENGLLFDKSSCIQGFIRNDSNSNRGYCSNEKEISRYSGLLNNGQSKAQRGNQDGSFTRSERSILQIERQYDCYRRRSEKQDFKDKMENGIISILGGIAAISDLVSNTQVNQPPKRRIKGYRTLSKRAMRIYAKLKANSSSFDWFEDEEEM